MRLINLVITVAHLPVCLMLVASASADVFNMPAGETSLLFASVGDAGNVADPATGYGAVAYNYNIGKYDVTAAQYTAFLNAVAATDTYGLYDTTMGTAFAACGIVQSGLSGSYTYSTTKSGNYPVNYVSWGNAARFCNWLANGQPTGAEGPGTTETGAYALNGGTSDAAVMAVPSPSHSGSGAAEYFIPGDDEWYKAAYYKTGGTNAGYWAYPTKNDTAPVNWLLSSGTNNANLYDQYGTGNHGYTDPTNRLTPVGYFAGSPGPYGTFDMGGDVLQWNETVFSDIQGSFRRFGGGGWNVNSSNIRASSYGYFGYPTIPTDVIGFRVASSVAVPEPGSLALVFCASLTKLIWWRRRK